MNATRNAGAQCVRTSKQIGYSASFSTTKSVSSKQSMRHVAAQRRTLVELTGRCLVLIYYICVIDSRLYLYQYPIVPVIYTIINNFEMNSRWERRLGIVTWERMFDLFLRLLQGHFLSARFIPIWFK